MAMEKFEKAFFDICSENFEPVSETMALALQKGINDGIIDAIKKRWKNGNDMSLPCGTFNTTLGSDGAVTIEFEPDKAFLSGIEKSGSVDPFYKDEGSILSENPDLIASIASRIKDNNGSGVVTFAVSDSEIAFLLNLWSDALRKALSFGLKSGKLYELPVAPLGVFSIEMKGDEVVIGFSADKNLKQAVKDDTL